MISPQEERVAQIVDPIVSDMGFALVRVKVMGGGKRATLQVMIEREGYAPVTLDDCSAVSNQLSSVFEVEDPISDAYNLEVSSTGIDRPLMLPRDFAYFAGYEVNISLKTPVEGGRKWRGELMGVTTHALLEEYREAGEGAELVMLDADEVARAGEYIIVIEPKTDKYEVLMFDFEEISSANLIINDKLLKGE